MNPFEFVRYESARLVSERIAVITVDLRKNAHLNDPALVEQGLDMFQARYPSFIHWTAEASGGTLTVTVEGEFNLPFNPFKE